MPCAGQSPPCYAGPQTSQCSLQTKPTSCQVQPAKVFAQIQPAVMQCQLQPAPICCSMRSRMSMFVKNCGQPQTSAANSGQARFLQGDCIGEIKAYPLNCPPSSCTCTTPVQSVCSPCRKFLYYYHKRR